ADILGRKRVIAAAMIVATAPLIMIALAPSLHALIFWRFILGLALPPIFTVVVAYIGEEWPPAQAMGVMGIYMAATSVGGFAGRFVSGVLADTVGWRAGFMMTAAMTLGCGIAVAFILPRERNFARSDWGAPSPGLGGDRWSSAPSDCGLAARCSPWCLRSRQSSRDLPWRPAAASSCRPPRPDTWRSPRKAAAPRRSDFTRLPTISAA